MIPNNTWSIRIAYCSAKLCSCVTIDNFALDLLYSMAQNSQFGLLNILNPYPLVFCPAICYNIGMILKCPEVSGLKRVICILSTLCICMMLLPARLNAAEICQQSRFSSTFLQNWLCRDWTEERWIHEFSDAKAAGFDSLIIQSTYDIVRGDCTGNKQDMCLILSLFRSGFLQYRMRK